MAQAHPLSQTTLQVKRTFGASRERVFRAWTNAEELRHWFFPSTDYTVVIPVLDLRVGGKYQLEMHHKDSGNIHRLERNLSRSKATAKACVHMAVGIRPRGQRDARNRRVPRSGAID